MTVPAPPYLLGHGTGNDFVVLPDPDGALELTPAGVRALCDRRTGLGADGVLRVVRTAAAGASARPPVGTRAEWFMDHRNADGSFAEMCGNGLRLFVEVLSRLDLVTSPEVTVATRAGLRATHRDGSGGVTVEMGAVGMHGAGVARLADRAYAGTIVDVGNPHLVCVLGVDPSRLDLTVAPEVDPGDFPDGANVEFVRAGDDGVDLRVHERGVGETAACGTGACAAAATVLRGRDGAVRVRQPGGTVTVTMSAGRASLSGPAEIVAAGTLDAAWWDRVR